MIEFIFMLTRDDVTLSDAREVYASIAQSGVRHVGCKDVGLPTEELRALMDDILQIRSLHNNLATVIVEHEMGVIERITERCVVLNFGRKIAEGPYRQVAADRQVQEAYLGVA